MRNLFSIPTPSLFILTIAACNPCEIDFVSGTAVVTGQCPVATTNETEADTTDGDSGDASTSGGEVCTWTHVPMIGEAWGPCNAFGDCGADLFCTGVENPIGDVCLPACVAEECPASGCGGTCLGDGACAPGCKIDTDCPFDGMICDVDFPFPTCLWPHS